MLAVSALIHLYWNYLFNLSLFMKRFCWGCIPILCSANQPSDTVIWPGNTLFGLMYCTFSVLKDFFLVIFLFNSYMWDLGICTFLVTKYFKCSLLWHIYSDMVKCTGEQLHLAVCTFSDNDASHCKATGCKKILKIAPDWFCVQLSREQT